MAIVQPIISCVVFPLFELFSWSIVRYWRVGCLLPIPGVINSGTCTVCVCMCVCVKYLISDIIIKLYANRIKYYQIYFQIYIVKSYQDKLANIFTDPL